MTEKLIIHGIKDDKDILWKKIKCKCDHSDPEKEYPLATCAHCKYQQQEDSMPRECFDVKRQKMDENGKPVGEPFTVHIKEITIVRGKHEDILGWVF